MKTKDVLVAVYIGLCQAALGAVTLHVAPPPLGNNSNPGTDQQPFATIQRGIDSAADGDVVLVAEGVYVEAIRFKGKNIAVRSTNPLDTNVVTNTVIDANWVGTAVTFAGTESEECVLEGFTVLKGAARFPGDLAGGICGGTAEKHARPVIRHNRIIDNGDVGIAFCDGVIHDNIIANNLSHKNAGGLTGCHGVIRNNHVARNTSYAERTAGGIAYCDGTIQDNVIEENSAYAGGGLAYCQAAIRNNTIRGNAAAGDGGGGLSACDGTIEGNLIIGNSSMFGGGLARCNGVVRFNEIAGNSLHGVFECEAAILNNRILANKDSGAKGCAGDIQNNTICDNISKGLFECHGTIRNCIVWGNAGGAPEQIVESAVPAYSCIQHWSGGGNGNIILYPHFASPQTGDYRLSSWSPCIDAGDPASDFSQEPAPNGGRNDMGAYGNTSGATAMSPDTDLDGLADDWEQLWFGSLVQEPNGDPDGDQIPNSTEYRYGSDPKTVAEGRVQNRTRQRWFQTIQTALDEAADGDQIVVEPGLYRESINFAGKSVLLQSTSPQDAQVASRTIIEGFMPGPAVQFAGTENETCLLAGFTIRYGGEDCGCGAASGGILGGAKDRHTKATIRHNVITGNSSNEGGAIAHCDGVIRNNVITNNYGWAGGGLANCNGTIQDNIISRNWSILGGGLFSCGGTIENNLITENLGHGNGGGLYACHGMILHNEIRGNWTEQDESAGGGLYGCNALVRGNVITDNRTRCHGAGGLSACGGTIENNIIARNYSDGTAGGLYMCGGLIQNNTIVGNRGYEIGGLLDCNGMIRNCIIWGNLPVNGAQFSGSSLPTYSCIGHWKQGGQGNISREPHFVDPVAGDYHLRSWSPCVDAGDPASDFSKEPQPNGSRVDMGAYGNTPEATAISVDGDADGLPDDWEVSWFASLVESGDSDPDGDGIINAIEYRHAWNPREPSATRLQNLTQGRWYATIQAALDEAAEGDEIVAEPGVYKENVRFSGLNAVLRSKEPARTAIVAATVIDAQREGSAVSFAGTEKEVCVLAGFTICNAALAGIQGNGTQATIRHNRVTQNSGSGLSSCHGLIANSVVWGNSSGYGGGLYNCDGVIQNCTVAGNVGALGGGMSDCDGVIRNCIIWDNVADIDPQMCHSSQPTYSCIQGWTGGGDGNIMLPPHLVAADQADFRLESWSPCIDAGDPASPFDNEPLPNGGRIDMGAYGNTPEATSRSADTDTDGLPDDWEQRWFGNLGYDGAADPDNDGITNARECRHAWDPGKSTGNLVLNRTQGLAYEAIQSALDESRAGDEIVVHPGIYREHVRWNGRDLVLRSVEPGNAALVSQTIIDGRQLGPVVAFQGGESPACVLAGFTIRNGNANTGGGILGARTHATVRDNVVTGNSASWRGGGIAGCDGLIQGNVITGNHASTIYGVGGGLAECNGAIQNNLVAGNSASEGGGLYHCQGTIHNNTIVGNSAHYGGGIEFCDGAIRHCIVWDNSDDINTPIHNSVMPCYSCIEYWDQDGTGNIAEDPQFVNPSAGDFRLLPSSPCIDAGSNQIPGLPNTDIAGNRRILYGGKGRTIDMGAFEHGVLACLREPGKATLTWSSVAGKTYSIACSHHLVTWQVAAPSISSAGDTTTSWTDDGSLTGASPDAVSCRFYRVVENP